MSSLRITTSAVAAASGEALAILERGGLLIWRRIEPWGKGLVPVRHTGQALALGLPCGLVYATLVWLLATADPLRGGALMAAFGIGTLPMLLALGSVADKLLSLTHRPRVRQISGSVIIVMGLLTLFGVVRPFHIGSHPVDHNLCGPDCLSGKVTN